MVGTANRRGTAKFSYYQFAPLPLLLRPWIRVRPTANRHPSPDECQKPKDQCEHTVLAVMMAAACLVAGEERRQLGGGPGQIQDADHN